MYFKVYVSVFITFWKIYLSAAEGPPSFRETVERVQRMSGDPEALRMAGELGLDIVNKNNWFQRLRSLF